MCSHYEAIKDPGRMLTIYADDLPLMRECPAQLMRAI
jgi:hypothetical protein